MAFKNWAFDEVGAAADLNRYWVQGVHVVKPSDETVTNSTSLQNDDHLFIAVAANTDYWMECWVVYDAPIARDMSLGWSLPSGATLDWSNNGLALGAGSTVDRISRTALTESDTATIGGGDTSCVCAMKGILRTGGTSGNLQMRFAQVSAAAATSVVVREGSQIMLTRLRM